MASKNNYNINNLRLSAKKKKLIRKQTMIGLPYTSSYTRKLE